VHNPPILILDEPTSDLDPNEKAEVIRYIQEIGKERTVVLSTHNLAEVEAACARAIIVSKGRVVADGALDDVRARSGTVRYHVVIHEQRVRGNGASSPPTAQQVQDALGKLPGVSRVNETPTDDRAHAFSLLAPKGSDLRPEIFELVVQKGWLLLEMRRDVKKLEDVFKTLTRGDEIIERGRKVAGDLADDEEPEEAAAPEEAEDEADEPDDEEPAEGSEDDEGSDDEAEDDEAEDDEDEDDEDEDDEKTSKKKEG
jgi:ABC-2 type transport system ATP-binding protein